MTIKAMLKEIVCRKSVFTDYKSTKFRTSMVYYLIFKRKQRIYNLNSRLDFKIQDETFKFLFY